MANATAKASMVCPDGNEAFPASDNFSISGYVLNGRSRDITLFNVKLISEATINTVAILKKAERK